MNKTDLEALSQVIDVSGAESFALNASHSQKKSVLQLSSKSIGPLKSNYEKLVTELSAAYYFKLSELHEILGQEIDPEFEKKAANKTTDAACAGYCSNGSENMYWRIYDLTRDMDIAVLAANSYYTGCLHGCMYK